MQISGLGEMETQIVELIDEIVTPFLALGYVEISVGFAAFFWAMKKAIGKVSR